MVAHLFRTAHPDLSQARVQSSVACGMWAVSSLLHALTSSDGERNTTDIHTKSAFGPPATATGRPHCQPSEIGSATTMSSKQLARLRAAAIDGRSQNVYFRQEQLERLCKGLLDEESALRQAMIEDCYYSASEAITVLHASVQAIKIVYAGLHPDQSLKQEYRTAHGKDVADGKVPFGMVYIEPEAHTLLYSICAPLSAALAAGNCVAVVVSPSHSRLKPWVRS